MSNTEVFEKFRKSISDKIESDINLENARAELSKVIRDRLVGTASWETLVSSDNIDPIVASNVFAIEQQVTLETNNQRIEQGLPVSSNIIVTDNTEAVNPDPSPIEPQEPDPPTDVVTPSDADADITPEADTGTTN